MDDPAAEYERRFRRAGLPLFIEDYSAGEDVFTRAAPLLALVFLGEMLGRDPARLVAARERRGGARRAWRSCSARFGLLNLARGRPLRGAAAPRRRARADVLRPRPGAAAADLRRPGRQRALTLLGNALLLALVYAWVGFGLFAILRWAGGRVFTQLAVSLQMLARAVPLLLVFALVLFINTEMWQVFSDMPEAFLALVGGLFVRDRLAVHLRAPAARGAASSSARPVARGRRSTAASASTSGW